VTRHITVLVATMSGTAQMVAEEILLPLGKAGYEARALRMERASPELLRQGGLFIICSSTYGTGDVPDNGKPLYEALQRERPDLSAVRYGVIALGDRSFCDTFCGGGRKFDELLGALGAQRIGERLHNDASSGLFPEECAIEWLEAWLPLVAE
jgi:MioC protein